MHWQKVILLIFIGILFSCARIVMPPGGPADKTPPEIKESKPENFSTQFYSNKIVLSFDEFIVLRDFNEQFVSSPLFNKMPDKVLKGKALVMKFDKDSLMPNTTYTLDFGNSIVDFRAGNPVTRYQYVFSTGDVIDSLFIRGTVRLSEDLAPQEKVWVMLYKDYNDSILQTQRPDFIAKTDVNGYYSINNIAPGTYSMFALKDINNNYLFDLPNEQIAFLDSVFVLKIDEEIHEEDFSADSLGIERDTILSLPKDSAELQKDTIIQLNDDISIRIDSNNVFSLDTNSIAADSVLSEEMDSVESHRHYRVSPEHIDLFLFEEAFVNSYLSDFSRPKRHLLNLIFSESQDSVISINFKDALQSQWIIEPFSKLDTFDIWLTDTAFSNRDSIVMFLSYYKTDTTQQLVISTDTLNFNFITKKKFKTKKQKKQEEKDSVIVKKKYVKINANFIQQPSLDFFKKPRLTLDFPIDSVDFSKIVFYEKIDTTFIKTEALIKRDSISSREFEINQVLKENTSYKIFVEPNAFIDYRGLGNDTLDQGFSTTTIDKYTEIFLDIQSVSDRQIVIQLLNSANKIVDERIVIEDEKLFFSNLIPGKFKVKMIDDQNRNGKWDTGDYALKIQAEEVRFFKETIETKANWSHDFTWNLSEEVTDEHKE